MSSGLDWTSGGKSTAMPPGMRVTAPQSSMLKLPPCAIKAVQDDSLALSVTAIRTMHEVPHKPVVAVEPHEHR